MKTNRLGTFLALSVGLMSITGYSKAPEVEKQKNKTLVEKMKAKLSISEETKEKIGEGVMLVAGFTIVGGLFLLSVYANYQSETLFWEAVKTENKNLLEVFNAANKAFCDAVNNGTVTQEITNNMFNAYVAYQNYPHFSGRYQLKNV